MSLEGHSGDPGEPFGLILGALGVVREALVDRLDSCWELWGSFGRPEWSVWTHVGSFGGHLGDLGGPFGFILRVMGSLWAPFGLQERPKGAPKGYGYHRSMPTGVCWAGGVPESYISTRSQFTSDRWQVNR